MDGTMTTEQMDYLDDERAGRHEIIPGAKPVPSSPLALEVQAQNRIGISSTAISATEPTVEPMTRSIDVPAGLIESGAWGDPIDVLRFLRTANGVPNHVPVAIADLPDGGTRITFS
ncbi:hypothetical protein PBI_APPA_62 [Microbacterium phage Appa]|uniref:Uncharacterized protein n=1 Tax=Microbacterium phage Appa TaxID=2182350 RepID=A0A2U8UHY9_9CAUD|nr:hypothetical protein HOT26_gp52 [Microbacterium phage Appa]AWN03243.1 hypothetical protein PBI_APPA_62 [Microbacterium phage Appa]